MNKEEILDIYKYKLEIHAHSNPASGCSEIPAEDFGDILIEDGFQGVALTNHLTPESLKRGASKELAIEYLEDYKLIKNKMGNRLSVILGCEIRFFDNLNDYLIYGIGEEDIEKLYYYLDKGLDTFYKEFKNDKNLIIQAHPFRNNMVEANPNSLDGIEAFNMHPGHNARIGLATKLANEHKDWVLTGGIDFHHQYQRGLFSMRTKILPKDSYELAELLKSGEYIFTVGNSIIIP